MFKLQMFKSNPLNLDSKKKKWIVTSLFVLSFSLMLVRTFFIPMGDAAGGRSFMRGDDYSDINTYSAILYFNDHGFWDSKLRPMHFYKGPGTEAQAVAYTHYPSLPDVTLGLWSKLIQSTDEVHLRFFPVLISIFFFFFIFLFLKKWLPDPRAAFLSAGLIVSSNYFIAWGDTLHKHTFEEVFKWVFVSLLLKYFQSQKPIILLYVFFALAAVVANLSFEPIVFLSVCTFGLGLVYEKSYFKKIINSANIFVASGFIFGFILHFYFNALYFDSWGKALEDLNLAFLHRTNQCTDAALCGMTLKNYLELPLVFVNRIERFFMIPGFAVLVLFLFARRKWKSESPETLKIAYVLLASSFAWYLAMSQHASVHTFTGKQVGLFVAWVVGTGFYEYAHNLKKDWHRRAPLRLGLHFVFLFYILAMALTQQVGELYWVHGFSRLF